MVLAAGFGLLAACGAEEASTQASGERSASTARAESESESESESEAATPARDFPIPDPIAAGPGEIRLDLNTHCGVEKAEVEGVLWLADPPLGNGSPPEGWGGLTTPGRWKQTGETTAVFLADSGVQADFVRPDSPPESVGGCA
jgi:hypothetical protein